MLIQIGKTYHKGVRIWNSKACPRGMSIFETQRHVSLVFEACQFGTQWHASLVFEECQFGIIRHASPELQGMLIQNFKARLFGTSRWIKPHHNIVVNETSSQDQGKQIASKWTKHYIGEVLTEYQCKHLFYQERTYSTTTMLDFIHKNTIKISHCDLIPYERC